MRGGSQGNLASVAVQTSTAVPLGLDARDPSPVSRRNVRPLITGE